MKACECVKCGNKWTSRVKKPQQCPACKRKDWDGLHSSTGRLLAGVAGPDCECNQCGHGWKSLVANPMRCPVCRRLDWSTVKVAAAGPGRPLKASAYLGADGRIECKHCLNRFTDEGGRYGVCPICKVSYITGEYMGHPRMYMGVMEARRFAAKLAGHTVTVEKYNGMGVVGLLNDAQIEAADDLDKFDDGGLFG